MQKRRTVDAATARRLAVKADCDPRSIRRIIAGEPVRGMSGQRALKVVRESGIEPKRSKG